MGSLVPYAFEGRTLRSLDRKGDPWFVAGDAASFLGYREAYDLTRSLESDEKGTHSVRTPGGDQEVSVISEAGLYRAILQRRAAGTLSPETREFIARFQRWVLHDVLPMIRRTGSYAKPAAAQVSAVSTRELRLAHKHFLAIGKMAGLDGSSLLIAANNATRSSTGIDILAEMGIKYVHTDIGGAQLNPTDLGKRIGLDARQTNKALVEHGYATVHRNAKGRLYYEPTEKGTAHGGHVVATGKQHSDGSPVTHLVWSTATVDALRRDLHGESQ